MKKIIFLLFLTLLLGGCGWKTNINKSGVKDIETNQNDLSQLIAGAFKQKYPEWDMSKVKIEITKNRDGYASGGVGFADEPGGGWWLAAAVGGNWKIVADGNGTVNCNDIEPYDFPVDIVPFCFDQQTGEMIDRQSGKSEVTAEEEIKKALEDNHDLAGDKIENWSIDGQENDLAKGSVTYQSGVGGWWLAAKKNNKWQIVTTGSDIVDCETVDQYGFSGLMVPNCYDFDQDKVINRVKVTDLDSLLRKVADFAGVEVSKANNKTFEWREAEGTKEVVGREVEIKKVEFITLEKIENYFKQNNFIDDMNNVASGTIVGVEGFARDTIVCQVRQEIDGGAEAMLAGEDKINIEVKCGTI